MAKMHDEHYYEQVVEELRVLGPKAGLWAKAFAEASGSDTEATALYLRYRVEQIADSERQRVTRGKAEEDERAKQEYFQAEEERKKLAKAEGVTPIHIILIGLPLLFLIIFAIRFIGNS
jgi:hypothetical protein